MGTGMTVFEAIYFGSDQRNDPDRKTIEMKKYAKSVRIQKETEIRKLNDKVKQFKISNSQFFVCYCWRVVRVLLVVIILVNVRICYSENTDKHNSVFGNHVSFSSQLLLRRYVM